MGYVLPISFSITPGESHSHKLKKKHEIEQSVEVEAG